MKGFGLENSLISNLDKNLALKRVQKDIASDLIFAPHFDIVFQKSQDELFEQLVAKFKSGSYFPKLPISMNVIKPNGFSRPGSILDPFDRLTYQLIVDLLASKAESEIDRTQVFSNRLIADDSTGLMFDKPHESYSLFQDRVQELCRSEKYRFVLRSDVASFFDRIYQHVLINHLHSCGGDSLVVGFLEKFLSHITQNDSHGIIQGVFPSDFLGNFSLCDIDAQHSLMGIEYARYVDDIYIFFNTINEARTHKVRLSNWLRKDGLTLNEGKTAIFNTENLLVEETELDILFGQAFEEAFVRNQIGYGSNEFLSLEDVEESVILETNLEVMEKLFETEAAPAMRRKIEKFCLPFFAAVDSDYCLRSVLDLYSDDPSMSQVYFGYLSKMVKKEPDIITEMESIFSEENLIFDYQRKWLYSTLLYATKVTENIVKLALSDIQNQGKNNALRAVCAILVGKFGGASYRRILKSHYSNENSEYVKSAILFSSQYFPSQEKDTCYRAWGGHNETNSLIVTALKKK